MAIRKATIKEQVAQAIAQVNPGDRPHVTIATVTGPSPWLTNSLGLIGQLLVKFYFVTVTDQAVVFHRFNRFTQRPKEVAYAIPRDQAQPLLGEVQRNPLWSSFRFLLPGEPVPTRLNVHRIWRDEMDQLIAMVTGLPAGAAPQGPQPPHGPQAPYGVPPQQAAQQWTPQPQMPPQGGPQPGMPPQPQQPYGAPAPGPQQPYGAPPHAGAPAPQPPYGAPQPHWPQQAGAVQEGPHQPAPGNPYAG